MNIPKLAPSSNIQRNSKNNFSTNHIGIKHDTISFRGKNEIKYDEVLIYHEAFDEFYEKYTNAEIRKSIDKKIEEFKKNTVFVNTYHGIDGCPGLFEYKPNSYRILFKIIDGKMVIISCFQKQGVERENNKLIDKTIDIVKSGKLEDFVAQSLEEDEEEITEEEFDPAEFEEQLNIKEYKKNIENSKQYLRQTYLNNASTSISLLSDAKNEYQGDKDELNEITEQIYEKFRQLEHIIDSLKYAEGDNKLTISDKINTTASESRVIYSELDALVNQALGIIDNKSISSAKSIVEKIEAVNADIANVFKDIKKKDKEISSMPNFNKNSAGYIELLNIQKRFNATIKRKAENIAKNKTLDDIDDLKNRLEEITELQNIAFDTYLDYEEKAKQYIESLKPRKLEIKKQDQTSKTQENSPQTSEPEVKKIDNEEDIILPIELVEEFADNVQPVIKEEVAAIIPEKIRQTAKTNSTEIIKTIPEKITIYRYPSFDIPTYAKKVFDIIEADLNKTMLPACARDINLLLIESLGEAQINKLKGLNETEFVELIVSKMKEISKIPKYATTARTANIAFLNEIALCTNIESANKLFNLTNSQVDQLYREILQGKKTMSFKDEFGKEFKIELEGIPDFDVAETNYTNLNYTLEYSEINELIETITKYTPDISRKDLAEYLQTQGKYLTLINDKTTPKTLNTRLLKYVFNDFDRIYNTNYAKTALKQIDKEGIESRVNYLISDEMLGTIDI